MRSDLVYTMSKRASDRYDQIFLGIAETLRCTRISGSDCPWHPVTPYISENQRMISTKESRKTEGKGVAKEMTEEKAESRRTIYPNTREVEAGKLTSPLWHGNGQIGIDHSFPSCGNRRRTCTVDIITGCKRTAARGGGGGRGELLNEEWRGLG